MKTLYIDEVAIGVFGEDNTLTLVHPRAYIADLVEQREQAAKKTETQTAQELVDALDVDQTGAEVTLADEKRKPKPRK